MNFFITDFVSKCLIATPSLYVPKTNQVVPSPPRTATPSGTIDNYDMEWRRKCPAECLLVFRTPPREQSSFPLLTLANEICLNLLCCSCIFLLYFGFSIR
ncbi:hypothetical protein TNCV_4892531 [Trichonephila clavipes]|nr:hypothetical protein TNCV_4892531 [Trichonephila clavipes]